MRKLVLSVLTICLWTLPLTAQAPAAQEIARWERQAQNVTIVRDDWGIAHVYGGTDADAVFGMIYAQAEDDFMRVENNYLTQLGRRAEAEGEARIFNDLRAKIFADRRCCSASSGRAPSGFGA